MREGPASGARIPAGLAAVGTLIVGVAAVLATPGGGPAVPTADPLDQWGQWRGPLASGVAPRGRPPVVWSEERGVRWKVAIPGEGHSSPVVWGNRVFLTTAIPHDRAQGAAVPAAPGAHDNVPATHELRFVVLAVDRRDGTIAWQTTVRTARPHDSRHESGSWASPSPVTDGEHVIVSFGSAGLYGLTTDGRLVWQVDLGDMRVLHGHGEGSSPALSGNTVVVNWDHEAGSFVVALDKSTGKERWRVARDEGTSWSTPLVVEHAGRAQVVVAATRRVRAYDLADGRTLWECGGLSGNVVASPVAADGYVYVGSSYDTRAMLAIRLDRARGDITGTDAVAWTRDRDTPYVPSPLLDGDRLCFLKHYQGLWSCLEAKTGRALYGPARLEGLGNVYASPVAAAEAVYLTDLAGTTVVLRRGSALEVLARNRLDDAFAASPALAGDTLFLRGARHLYCLADAAAPPR